MKKNSTPPIIASDRDILFANAPSDSCLWPRLWPLKVMRRWGKVGLVAKGITTCGPVPAHRGVKVVAGTRVSRTMGRVSGKVSRTMEREKSGVRVSQVDRRGRKVVRRRGKQTEVKAIAVGDPRRLMAVPIR